jgi:hypothetical protein
MNAVVEKANARKAAGRSVRTRKVFHGEPRLHGLIIAACISKSLIHMEAA